MTTKDHLLMLIFLALFCSVEAYSAKPKVKKVTGTAIYLVSEDMNITLKEAKQKCIELAKANAIASEFGEFVNMGTIDVFMDSSDMGSTSFNIGSTSTQSRALWLGDTRNPQVSVAYRDNLLTFTAEVWGEAREILTNATDVKWKIAHLAGKQKIETTTFHSGEQIYVNFQSVSNGYVAIYLVENNENTYCMLPAATDTDGRQDVRAGREYEFFDKEADRKATLLKLTTKQAQEYNQLVLIYSPNPFTKSVDTVTGPNKLSKLSTRDFSKWLLKCQRNDPDMVVEQHFLKIVNASVDNE